MLGTIRAITGVLVTAALAGAAVLFRALTPYAGLTAALFGSFIVIVGGFPYLALLILFVLATSLATHYRFPEKQRARVQEGLHGERGVPNVLAHILIPTALVAWYGLAPASLPAGGLAVLYTAALAFGSSDTFASEFGVLDPRAWGLLSTKPVTAGTNGGVSSTGEIWGLVGAATTGAVGWLLCVLFAVPVPDAARFVAVTAAAGFAGCQVDSVLGETLENRGWLTKSSTNFFAMASAVGIAIGLLAVFGGPIP